MKHPFKNAVHPSQLVRADLDKLHGGRTNGNQLNHLHGVELFDEMVKRMQEGKVLCTHAPEPFETTHANDDGTATPYTAWSASWVNASPNAKPAANLGDMLPRWIDLRGQIANGKTAVKCAIESAELFDGQPRQITVTIGV